MSSCRYHFLVFNTVFVKVSHFFPFFLYMISIFQVLDPLLIKANIFRSFNFVLLCFFNPRPLRRKGYLTDSFKKDWIETFTNGIICLELCWREASECSFSHDKNISNEELMTCYSLPWENIKLMYIISVICLRLWMSLTKYHLYKFLHSQVHDSSNRYT